MRNALVFFLSLFFAHYSLSQTIQSVEEEVRAVWITTALGLDWPQTYDIGEQQASLIRMVRTLKRHNFNTIFFQVRAKGDAYYRSSLEPWAENLTGSSGKDPHYDPLAVLLKEAHDQGMEVHAWFNLYKVGRPRQTPGINDRHVSREHPEWTYEYEGGVWLNPGVPAVNPYLVRVAMDLVRRYPVDGIQFDFIRYPGTRVPDKDQFARFGGRRNLADWRRDNIDRFVSAFHDSVSIARPLLKIGATPVGNFDGNERPAGYTEFYQNAPGWLESGKIDYIVPQIYWSLGNSPADPDFAALARRWAQVSHGRHVYAGIGAYKPEVLRELMRQVDSTRVSGCVGHAFFRYGNMGDFSSLRNRYQRPAPVPAMPWKKPQIHQGPRQLAVTGTRPGIRHVEWTPVEGAESYRLYRSRTASFDRSDSVTHLATTGKDVTFYVDSAGPSGITWFYAATATDGTGRESQMSPFASSIPDGLEELREIVTLPVSLSASVDKEDATRILIAYNLPEETQVSITLQQDARTTTNPLVTNLVGGLKPSGTHVLGVDRAEFPPGEYFVVLRTREITINRRLTLE